MNRADGNVARLLLVLALGVAASAPAAAARGSELPESLFDTGLYDSNREVHPDATYYTPQYPLWSDGAAKRRWFRLPEGTRMTPEPSGAWSVPRGSKFWKEFAYTGRVETRMIERLQDGSYRFSTYVWNQDGTQARLAGAAGAVLAADGAPGGRYEVPSRGDCLACHDVSSSPILGLGTLQMSDRRDAADATARSEASVTATQLVRAGLLAPSRSLEPTIAGDPLTRAALGYLHGNCGHCHAAGASSAAVPVDLSLRWTPDAPPSLESLLATRTRMQRAEPIVEPGRPEESLLLIRMKSMDPLLRMPPLGTREPDRSAIDLLERWIRGMRKTNAKQN